MTLISVWALWILFPWSQNSFPHIFEQFFFDILTSSCCKLLLSTRISFWSSVMSVRLELEKNYFKAWFSFQWSKLLYHYILQVLITRFRSYFLVPITATSFFSGCLNCLGFMRIISWSSFPFINPLSANPLKWSNTLKQFVGKLLINCLSVWPFCGLGAWSVKFVLN